MATSIVDNSRCLPGLACATESVMTYDVYYPNYPAHYNVESAMLQNITTMRKVKLVKLCNRYCHQTELFTTI